MLNNSGLFWDTINANNGEYPPEKDEARMGDFYASMIGVVFATVSTIIAVRIVLILPYKIRVCEFSSRPFVAVLLVRNIF